MKTNLKSLMMAALFAGLGSAAFAQQTSFAPATAEILTSLSIELDVTQNAISFGNVSATTLDDIVLGANGTGNANTGSLTNVARFDLTGADSEVTVSYDPIVPLSGPGADLIMTPEVIGAALSTEQEQATAVANGTGVTPSAGLYFLWVGGVIPQLNGQETGTYTGQFDISVEYN